MPLGVRWQSARRANDCLHPGVSQKSGEEEQPCPYRRDRADRPAGGVGIFDHKRTGCGAIAPPQLMPTHRRHRR